MDTIREIASVVLAAGRGSRMKDFTGNKTLLPLIPEGSPYDGKRPMLLEIISNLPGGPKAIVVHYRKDHIEKATSSLHLTYCHQPELNGTGGGLLAARSFLENLVCDHVIITMGDVPLVKRTTYEALIRELETNDLVVLGFRPKSRKQYGILETEGPLVRRIVEWKYWSTYSDKEKQSLHICNSGIYAARRHDLLKYLLVLGAKPHKVFKEIEGRQREVEEYFMTDIIEYMYDDDHPVGYILTEEEEVIGVDDRDALEKVQESFRLMSG
ncbi:MAG: NTP transferase domain-containing protein [Desulfatiglans sp.]|nr:NTP transferase domain-containing protein [Thermodesulfobacteriota bacterium]MEE4354003.1 NTP transferase domain-containing protein [Desulfatiglans sp.]